MGRTPTPTKLLEKRGSRMLDVRKKGGEPTLPVKEPDPPYWLDGKGLEVWHDLVKRLLTLKVISEVDGIALARYCRTYVEWLYCEEFLRNHGSTTDVLDKDGNVLKVIENPQAKQFRALGDQLTRLEDRFGMTPSARARLAITLTDLRRAENKTAELINFG